jgi:hypothetical protein
VRHTDNAPAIIPFARPTHLIPVALSTAMQRCHETVIELFGLAARHVLR